MRRKNPHALSQYTREQYARAIERGHGTKTPNKAPDFSEWPESTRKIYRAAIQAYWLERDDEVKGLLISKQVHEAGAVERVAVFPNSDEAQACFAAGERAEPRAFWLVMKLMWLHGIRTLEGLKLSREHAESAARYGKLVVLGKGNKERVFHVPQSQRLLRELLNTPREDGKPWTVLGELLSADGTFDTQRLKLTAFMRRVAESAGLDPKLWHPHALRHVFSDDQLALGTNPRELQALLGHKRLETVARYTHPRPEQFSRNIRKG